MKTVAHIERVQGPNNVTLVNNPTRMRCLQFEYTQDPATVAAWASAAAVNTFEVGLVLDTTV